MVFFETSKEGVEMNLKWTIPRMKIELTPKKWCLMGLNNQIHFCIVR